MTSLNGMWCYVVLGLLLVIAEPTYASSPLQCGIKQMGVRNHIECEVTSGRLQIKEVQLNSGACQTMQEYYQNNPQQRARLKAVIQDLPTLMDYRRSFRQGQKFIIYLMPCALQDYRIETDLGTWGWLAPRM